MQKEIGGFGFDTTELHIPLYEHLLNFKLTTISLFSVANNQPHF